MDEISKCREFLWEKPWELCHKSNIQHNYYFLGPDISNTLRCSKRNILLFLLYCCYQYYKYWNIIDVDYNKSSQLYLYSICEPNCSSEQNIKLLVKYINNKNKDDDDDDNGLHIICDHCFTLFIYYISGNVHVSSLPRGTVVRGGQDQNPGTTQPQEEPGSSWGARSRPFGKHLFF